MNNQQDSVVVIDFLAFDGSHRKEPDGLAAFEPADPHDIAQIRFVQEQIAARREGVA